MGKMWRDLAMQHITWNLDAIRKPDPDYCPYCNCRFAVEQMTVDHVIPECVGGARLKTPACAKCNHRMGTEIDPLLARILMLRLYAIRSGRGPTRQERHKGMVRLKDGRELHGSLFVEFVGNTEYRFDFTPEPKQPDGSRWLHEAVCAGNIRLPESISVLRKEDIEYHCVIPGGIDALGGTEPAMMKIMLGFLHCSWGGAYTADPAFDRFRALLTTMSVPTSSGVFSEGGPRSAPVPAIPGTHLVWGACENGELFSGGVSLYGRWTHEFTISDFGLRLEGRLCQLPVYAS
jgi:hypothetical protein